MLTGVTTADRLAALPDAERPTAVAEDAAGLAAALERARRRADPVAVG